MKFLGNPSSGSTANLTYSHNRAGQYTRNRRAPVQPIGTGRRAFIRAAFGNAAQAWSSLSAADQASWAGYAALYPVTDALGQSITLSGQQMFIGINTELINCGQPTVTVPPSSNTQDDLAPVVLTASATGTPAMTITWTAGTSGNFVLLAMSQPVSGGTNFWKTYNQLHVADASLGTFNILAAYEAQFGTIVSGQKIFARVTPVNSFGVKGSPTIVSQIVT